MSHRMGRITDVVNKTNIKKRYEPIGSSFGGTLYVSDIACNVQCFNDLMEDYIRKHTHTK